MFPPPPEQVLQTFEDGSFYYRHTYYSFHGPFHDYWHSGQPDDEGWCNQTLLPGNPLEKKPATQQPAQEEDDDEDEEMEWWYYYPEALKDW